MGSKAPKAPDPKKVAEAQTQSNIATAREQSRLGMTGQETPWGSIQWVADPTSPSGYRSITQLSPEQQALMQQGQDLQAQYGSAAGQQLGRATDVMGQDFDLNAARATEISDMQRTFLDPQWSQRSQELESSLLNRGIRPGSEAYDREMTRFNQQREGAYNQMFLDAYRTANDAALKERNIPISDLGALGMGAFPMGTQAPTFGSTPQPGVAPTDITGPTYQSYQGNLSASNAQMGGLFGLGSSLLGGWASAGFPGATALLGALSDRRTKTDVEKIGDDPRGWGVYRFRYIFDEIAGLVRWQLGFMAQEVEKVRPDAVTTLPNGLKMIDYDTLALG